jgi:hypothetical protein
VVDWLRRLGQSPAPESPSSPEPLPEAVEGAAPGASIVLKGVSEDRSYSVIDLGPASDQSLRVYGRFARWIRFADVLGESWHRAPGSAAGLLEEAVPQGDRPYDLVFAWDFLDRLFPDSRPQLAEWLADVTAPDARVHLLVRTSEDVPMQPMRFVLLDVDRIRYEPTSSAKLPPSRLLPADVARVLAPLQVAHAYTLKTGFREYVAIRR